MSDDIFYSEMRTNEQQEPARPGDETIDSQPQADLDPDCTIPGDSAQSNLSVPQLKIGTAFRSQDPMHLPIGEVYADFFIVGELGRGTFGVVYLAEQISLKRTVALKVTDTSRDDGCGFEGRTMAQLEHPSIVRIYQELLDETQQRRLLCMQYVPGTNLRNLITRAREKFDHEWDGPKLLGLLNEGGMAHDVVLQETSLADREIMASANQLEAICWIGEQSAFALEHAHRRGYIHRDVKPANTIINRFGRPMLVDFNLAIESEGDADRGIIGGTIPYMSPESMRAFADNRLVPTENAISADVYSLGVMLWELSCGEFPFESKSIGAFSKPDKLDQMIALRKISPEHELVNHRLAKVLRKAFHFDPVERFSSARDFGQTLRGVTQQTRAIESRNNKSWLTRSVLKAPKIWMLLAGFLPHVLASILQIAYNFAEIVDRLNPAARSTFEWLLLWINPIVYGICAIFAINRMIAVLRPWESLQEGIELSESELHQARDKLLSFPRFVATAGGLGWLFSALAFPLIIYFGAQRFSLEVFLHFMGSFAISGAMAVTFSYCLLLAVIIYAIYPELFDSPVDFEQQSQEQLGPLRAYWPKMSMLAGGIPLIAVILLVANFCPEDLLSNDANSYRELAFKSLVIGLILASALGFGLVRRVGQSVIRLIDQCMQVSSK